MNTNLGAVKDRFKGTLLVFPFNSRDVTVFVEVLSRPCPSVQWQFNGINVSMEHPLFSFNNPCNNKANFSPYEFNFTISNLFLESSGNYSALFNNDGFSRVQRLPQLYITVPGKFIL